MPEKNQETEGKFYLQDMPRMQERLRVMGASLIQPRTLEINLRFDTPHGDFMRDGRVLRLRRDQAVHLTYKDQTKLYEGALSRREIEFSVNDFDSARQFIEALGYQVVFIYEKYRTTYSLTSPLPGSAEELQAHQTHIMVDELPYGNFIEIEGEIEELKPQAEHLGLNWDTAIPASYHTLFDHVSKTRDLKFRDLCFVDFKGITISPSDLGVLPADR